MLLGRGWDYVEVTHDFHEYIDGLGQDCNNSIANAMELLQSCT